MLSFEHIPNTNITKIVTDGEWGPADAEVVILNLRSFIQQHGQIGLLESISKPGSGNSPLFWDEITTRPDLVNRIPHVAVVGDVGRVDVFSAYFRDVAGADVRSFDETQYEHGIQWLRSFSTPAVTNPEQPDCCESLRLVFRRSADTVRNTFRNVWSRSLPN